MERRLHAEKDSAIEPATPRARAARRIKPRPLRLPLSNDFDRAGRMVHDLGRHAAERCARERARRGRESCSLTRGRRCFGISTIKSGIHDGRSRRLVLVVADPQALGRALDSTKQYAVPFDADLTLRRSLARVSLLHRGMLVSPVIRSFGVEQTEMGLARSWLRAVRK